MAAGRTAAIVVAPDAERRAEAERRAGQVKDVLERYQPDDKENALRDLLADMLHFCDIYGVDFENELRVARDNHLSEVEGEWVTHKGFCCDCGKRLDEDGECQNRKCFLFAGSHAEPDATPPDESEEDIGGQPDAAWESESRLRDMEGHWQ
jgi:hypothetical protein